MSLTAVAKMFSDEAAAWEYVEQLRWDGKPVCPRCGTTDVLALGGAGEAAGSAVDAGRGDGDEEDPVEAGVLAVRRLVAAFGVFDHRAMVARHGPDYWRKSDITVGAVLGGRGRGRPVHRREKRARPGLTCDYLVTYHGCVDEVFRALADPTRRSLLDELFREDGQTLSMLEERFSMTRFGVMKHLNVLEEAGLVVTRRRGREKLHFLNPVPIRLVHDRWVSKYAEPWVAGLSDIKQRLESQMEKIYEIYIRTTPERLWEAITDPEIRSKYNFGAGTTSDWKVGSPLNMDVAAQGVHLGEGEVLEVDPPRRLVHTMIALWGDDVKREGQSRVTWEIEPVGDSCHLTVTHDQMREGANDQIYGGWPMILSGLKTWLESGELLTTPGSLMYGASRTWSRS